MLLNQKTLSIIGVKYPNKDRHKTAFEEYLSDSSISGKAENEEVVINDHFFVLILGGHFIASKAIFSNHKFGERGGKSGEAPIAFGGLDVLILCKVISTHFGIILRQHFSHLTRAGFCIDKVLFRRFLVRGDIRKIITNPLQ